MEDLSGFVESGEKVYDFGADGVVDARETF